MNNRSLDNFQLFKGVPWMIVHLCEAVLILTGNFITIFMFWSIRKQLRRTSYLLINLAAADILVGIRIALFVCNYFVSIEKLTKTATIVGLVGTLCSLLSMALISLERMSAVLWPFRHRVLNIWHYHISVGIVWLVAFSIASTNVSINLSNTESNFKFVTAITIFFSVIVISGAYLAIWISTRRNRMPCRTDRSMEQDRKLAKTLFLVTVLSIIAYLPNGVNYALSTYLENMHSFWVQIIIVVQQSNSFLNPVVYCFKMPEFRDSLNNFLCRCSRPSRPRTTGEVTLTSLRNVGTL